MMGGYLAAEELNDLDTYIVPESLDGDQGILGSLCLGAAEWAREHGGREA